MEEAVEEAYGRGMRHFMCGMARGADFYFCETVLKLRRRCPDVTMEAVLPCEEQAARWRERERERYFTLVERCDRETMVQRRYDEGCMLRRNRYMVDRSALLIAVYDGMLGGTMYTLTYAMRQGLDVKIPEEMMKKPDKRIYYTLLERYHLKADECIFIDDSQANIDTANKIGIHGLLWRHNPDEVWAEIERLYHEASAE